MVELWSLVELLEVILRVVVELMPVVELLSIIELLTVIRNSAVMHLRDVKFRDLVGSGFLRNIFLDQGLTLRMPLWVSLRASLRVPLRMTLWMTLRVPRRRLIWSWTIVLLRISVESLILRWESLASVVWTLEILIHRHIDRLVLVLSIHLRVLVPNEHLRGNLLGKTLHRAMEPLITFSQFSLVSTGPLKQILNDFLKFLVVYFE